MVAPGIILPIYRTGNYCQNIVYGWLLSELYALGICSWNSIRNQSVLFINLYIFNCHEILVLWSEHHSINTRLKDTHAPYVRLEISRSSHVLLVIRRLSKVPASLKNLPHNLLKAAMRGWPKGNPFIPLKSSWTFLKIQSWFHVASGIVLYRILYKLI